jgi:tetratricopeptide (TPR) repeat protein
MRFACLRILPLLLVGALACQDDAAKVGEHMARGKQYVEEKKFNEAVIEFKSVLQIDPNVADAHYQLAHAYFAINKPGDGYWELRETVRLDPKNTEAVLEFSQVAIAAGEQEEALKQVGPVLEADPGNARAHLLRGQALAALGRQDEAFDAFVAANQADPDSEGALRMLASIEARRENWDQARHWFDGLVQRHPTFENLMMRGLFEGSLTEGGYGGTREAQEQFYLRGLEVAEGDQRPRAYGQLAGYYVERDQTDRAFALLEGAAEIEEDPVEVIYLLARLHRQMGNGAKADELIREATERSPDNPRVHLVLAAYHVRQGEMVEALAAVEKAAELAPDDRNVQIQKAEVLVDLGALEKSEEYNQKARAILDEVLAAEPSNPDALLVDAKYKVAQKDLEGAEQQLRAAVDSRPNWGKAYQLLGVILAAQNDYTGARNELGRALEIDSTLSDAKLALAQVHFNLGEWDYCINRAREYLTEVPGDRRARLVLAQSLVRLGKIDEAEADLESIPEAERDGEILFALGRIEQMRGHDERARELLLQANAEMPGQVDILTSLLQVEERMGRLADSKARIEKALAEKPDEGKLHQLAGMLALSEKRFADAEASFQRAIELDPGDLQAYERLASYYGNSGRLEDAAKVYERAVAARPEEARFHHFLGVLNELAGHRDRAIKNYEDAIRYGSDLVEAKNNLAYLYAEEGVNLDRALDLAQDAKSAMPDNPSVSDTLGWVLFRRGVPSAAITYLKEAEAATDPNDASIGVIRFHLAQAYAANGDEAEALAAVGRSLEAQEAQIEAAKQRGQEAPTPDWVDEARKLEAKLAPAAAAAD